MSNKFFSMIRGAFVRNKRDAASRTPGQNVLLRGVRLHENKEMGGLIKEASVDDLEWFLQMLELQLEETPNWIKDESQLHEMQAWTRRVRTMVVEVFHNKSLVARRRAWLLGAGGKLFLVILGAALGWALKEYFG
jgi:hypothetical protein